MSTLTAVIDQLQYNKEATEDTTEAVSQLSKSIEKFILKNDRDNLDELEQSREFGLPSMPGPMADTSVDGQPKGSMFGGLLRSLGVAGMFQGILRMLSPILAPITAMFTFLKNPKFIKALGIFGLMYEIFKDIGENETLQNTLKTINELWTNSMLPALRAIGDSVLSLVNSIDTTTEFASLTDWWNNVRKTVQDFVAVTLEDIVVAIDGVLTGIKTTLEGDWLTGITTIVNSLTTGIMNIVDNAITSILKLFGVDFGTDGTFLGYLDRKWSELTTAIQIKWDAAKTAISNGWNTTVDAVAGTWNKVTTTISNGWDTIVNTINESWNTVTTTISNGWDTIVNTINESWDSVTTAISNGWERVTDFFTISIPIKFALVKLELQRIATGIYDSVVDAANSMINVITVDIPNKIIQVKTSITEKANQIYDSILTKVTSLVTSIVDLIPSAEAIKRNLVQTIALLPGGEGLLDLLGVEYQKAPKPINTEDDFFDSEMRNNKGMSFNPMAYTGAQPFGTAYTSNPQQKFAELMEFRQPPGTIAAPVVIQDNSVKSSGGNTTVTNQIDLPVQSHDASWYQRRSNTGLGF